MFKTRSVVNLMSTDMTVSTPYTLDCIDRPPLLPPILPVLPNEGQGGRNGLAGPPGPQPVVDKEENRIIPKVEPTEPPKVEATEPPKAEPEVDPKDQNQGNFEHFIFGMMTTKKKNFFLINVWQNSTT